MRKFKLEKPGSDRPVEVELSDGTVKIITIPKLNIKQARERDKKIVALENKLRANDVSPIDYLMGVIRLRINESEKETAWLEDLEDEKYLRQLLNYVVEVQVGGKGDSDAEETKKKEKQ